MWLLVLVLAVVGKTAANYRHLLVDNSNLCAEKTILDLYKHKRISIGTGALILELSKPRIAFHPHQSKSKWCEIHVEAPEGFGIFAYVEDAYLRRNRTDLTCTDYIQFGQDDSIPVFTLHKSDKLCGPIEGRRNATKGFMYDDPSGKTDTLYETYCKLQNSVSFQET